MNWKENNYTMLVSITEFIYKNIKNIIKNNILSKFNNKYYPQIL